MPLPRQAMQPIIFGHGFRRAQESDREAALACFANFRPVVAAQPGEQGCFVPMQHDTVPSIGLIWRDTMTQGPPASQFKEVPLLLSSHTHNGCEELLGGSLRCNDRLTIVREG